MPSVRPEHDDAFWADLAARTWRRVRWRRSRSPDAPPDGARCVAFDTPIHRVGTYYVRPAYTDGTVWLSQQGYDAMVRRVRETRPTRKTTPRRGGRPPRGEASDER